MSVLSLPPSLSLSLFLSGYRKEKSEEKKLYETNEHKLFISRID